MTSSTRSSRSSMLTTSHSHSDPSAPNPSANGGGRVPSFHLCASAPLLLEPVTHSKLNIHTPRPGSKKLQDAKSFESSSLKPGSRRPSAPHANALRASDHALSTLTTGTTRKPRSTIRLPVHYKSSDCGTRCELPDRYIPLRESNCAPTTPFHVLKKPRELSPEEKLLRRRPPKDDPFMPSHLPRYFSGSKVASNRVFSPHYRPHLVTEPTYTGSDSPFRHTRDISRQISYGAVWNVGGNSASLGRASTTVARGSGSHFASGTTAPMFTARFLPQTAANEEREKHKSRVALALDFDPATRLIQSSKPWSLLRGLPNPASSDYERFSPFVWKDNAWKRNGRDLCKCQFCSQGQSSACIVSCCSSNEAPGRLLIIFCRPLSYLGPLRVPRPMTDHQAHCQGCLYPSRVSESSPIVRFAFSMRPSSAMTFIAQHWRIHPHPAFLLLVWVIVCICGPKILEYSILPLAISIPPTT